MEGGTVGGGGVARLPFSSSAIAAVTASSAFSPSPDGISSGTCACIHQSDWA